MEKVKVKIKKLTPEAVLPVKAHPTDAGADITATEVSGDKEGNIVCHTGLAMEIPEGYVGLLFPRSSVTKKDLSMANAVGVIDCHYRGEVTAKFKYAARVWGEGGKVFDFGGEFYKAGDKCCQLIVMPIPEVEYEEAEELSETDRGEGGYGSTDKK